MKKAKPNRYVPKIRLAGVDTKDGFVNPTAGVAAIDTDDGGIIFDTYTGQYISYLDYDEMDVTEEMWKEALANIRKFRAKGKIFVFDEQDKTEC